MRLYKSVIAILVFFYFVIAFLAAPLWASDLKSFRVGAAKVDITPSNLTNLNPWGGTFKNVHDPIFARVLILDNNVNTVALVVLDLAETGDTTEVRKRIQSEVGIPVDHIIISSIHDHSAPRAGVVTSGGLAHGATSATEGFTTMLYDKIVAAVKQAKASLQPARFGLGTGICDINVNRDEYVPQTKSWIQGVNQDRPSDKTVWVIKFETMSGEPIAVFFNYAVHSAVALGTGSLSGDLGGAAARYVEERYNNKVVAMYTMGPAGDQNPRIMFGGGGGPGVSADTTVVYDAMNAMGTMLGAEVVRIVKLIPEMTSSVRLEAAERIISCPVKEGVNQMGDMKQEKVASMPLHLGLIMINQVALTGVSGEVVTNIYLHLKKASPLTNTIMITLANDRVGYIVDNAAYDTPYFETNGTPIARGYAENGIVDGLVEMINKCLDKP